MGTEKKGGYIEKLLKKADNALQEGVKKADKALQEGVKKADHVLDNAVEIGMMTAKQASKTSKEIRNQAKKESSSLRERGMKKINEGVSAAKNVTSNTKDDLETLKKLGKLRTSGIITEKEFQAKKKKILDRI
ncbi:MAG: SHOCT domain-containing protein [Nitrosopumilus sp.]|nr:SHOCT domain-containing protein [Nitrososphaerota archaeon]